jgi:hypothetical protein
LFRRDLLSEGGDEPKLRMWFVDQRLMCHQHLLGEHRELHGIVGLLLRGKNVEGYHGLIEVHNVMSRHGEIVEEMRRRNYEHKSPLSEFEEYVFGEVDREENLKELSRRCRACREIQV